MVKAPYSNKENVNKGAWSLEEDKILKDYIEKHGLDRSWTVLLRDAGINRCPKSCRSRWLNYLRPEINHGGFTDEEEKTIYSLYNKIGRSWSTIASHLPGRTDLAIKNYWHSKSKKKVMARRRLTTTTTTFTSTTTTTTTHIQRNTSLPPPLIPPIDTETNNNNCNHFSMLLSDNCPTLSSTDVDFGFTHGLEDLVCEPSTFPDPGTTEALDFGERVSMYILSPPHDLPALASPPAETNKSSIFWSDDGLWSRPQMDIWDMTYYDYGL